MQAEIVGDDQAAQRLWRAQQPFLQLGPTPELPALPEQPLDCAGQILELVPAGGAMGEIVLALASWLDIDLLVSGNTADQRDAGLLRGKELGGRRHPEALRHPPVT